MRPPVLQIEPTDACNMRCAMCGPHQHDQPHGIPEGVMDPSLYRRILEGLRADGGVFDHVILQWMGEPLLHPALPALLGETAAALAGRVGYLRVDTNALRLDPETLLAAWAPSGVPLLLVFSLDAATEETWARVKRPVESGNLGHVRQAVRRAADWRRRHPGAPLHLQVQFVVQAQNAHEARAFVDYWRAFFACRPPGVGRNEILLKRLSVGTGGPAQDDADALYDRTIADQGLVASAGPPADVVLWARKAWDSPARTGPRPPCPAPWLTPVIRHDGHLFPCCADVRGTMDLGSLADARFAALWQGPRVDAMRLAHVEGRLDDLPTCAACGGFTWYSLSDDEIARWKRDRRAR